MTMTLNGTTGIVVPTNAAPAFSAYQSSTQTLSSATFTKIMFQTKEFDTNNNFDNVTNYRFTPTVAGYYYVDSQIWVASSSTTVEVSIYKNGTEYKRGFNAGSSVTASGIFSLVYLNGSTDYIEIYGYVGTGQALNASSALTYFNGSFVRSA